jgi:ABC-type branched-subunit amino acid transport system permease subunit
MTTFKRFLPSLILCVLVALCSPFFSSYGVSVLTQVVAYTIALVGLDLIVSRVRMMSFGQGGFMAIAAYTSVALLERGLPFELAALIAVAGTAVIAALLAVPVSRLTGFSFALVTFAFTAVVSGLAGGGMLYAVTGGESGLTVPAATLFGFDLLDPRVLLIVSVIALALVMTLTTSLIHSRTGRALRTIRESETVAAALGIRVAPLKIGTFAFAGAIAGTAGILLAQTLGAMSPHTFGLDQSVLLVAMLTVGGLGRVLGPFVGAALFIVIPEVLQEVQSYAAIVFPIVFIIALILAPKGIVGSVEDTIAWFRNRRSHGRPANPTGDGSAKTKVQTGART